MPLSTAAVRSVVLVLAALAAAGQVVYLDAVSWRLLGSGPPAGISPPLVTAVAAHALLSLFAGASAVLVAFRIRPTAAAGRGLALAVGAWSYLLAYPGVVLLLRPDPGPLRALFEGHFLMVETVGLAGLIRFTALFPRPLPHARSTPAGPDAWPARAVAGARAVLLRPGPVWMSALLLPLLLLALGTARGRSLGDIGLSPFMDVIRVAAATAVVLNLRDGWRDAQGSERRRLSWLLAALATLLGTVLLVIAGNILLSATGWSEPSFAWRPVALDLGVMGFVAGLVATQIAPEHVDAHRVARRIVSLVGLAMILLVAATVGEVLLASGILGPVALPPGLGAAVAVVAVASVAPPLLRRLEGWLHPWPGLAPGEVALG